MKRLSIVIPALDEAPNLSRLLPDLALVDLARQQAVAAAVARKERNLLLF